MDNLSGLAPLLRVRPEVRDFCQFGGAWVSPHDQAPGEAAEFHIVVRGNCVIELPRRRAIELQSGSILLLPHGDGHVVRAGRGATEPAPISTSFRNTIRRKTTPGDDGVDTELICGLLHFESVARNFLVATLPDTIVLDLTQDRRLTYLRDTVSVMRDELDAARLGAMAIAADLASAIFMMLLRQHIEDKPALQGSLALLGNAMTARAVTAMVRDPAANWTLDLLAERGGTSRATLVRAFRREAGVAPLEFLTELRLALAMKRLQTTPDPIAQIALDAGYQSEGAFSRAFTRRFNIRPGACRQGTMASSAS